MVTVDSSPMPELETDGDSSESQYEDSLKSSYEPELKTDLSPFATSQRALADCFEYWGRGLLPTLKKTATWLQRVESFSEDIGHTLKHPPANPLKNNTTDTALPRLRDDLRQIISSTSSLEELWHFLNARLKGGGAPEFTCFSILDETAQLIRIRFLFDANPPAAAKQAEDLPVLSLQDTHNHLVQAYQRKDTTFSPHLSRLGKELLSSLPWAQELSAHGDDHFNLFSIPFVAGNRTIALFTLGFQDLDAFSQAKLSYVYGLKDSLSQLIWNLTLQERMKIQTQMDNLTGLLSYTSFQDMLERELDRTDRLAQSLSIMIMDVDELQTINREQGHSVGDSAICYIASTVRRLVRGVDTVARYGGDKIVILLPETDRIRSSKIASILIDGIHERLPINLQQLTVSIGHATYPDDIRNRAKLLKLTEQAKNLAQYKSGLPKPGADDLLPDQDNLGKSTMVAASEIDSLNDKTVIEIFASQVAKKYESIHISGVYQSLVQKIEKRDLPASSEGESAKVTNIIQGVRSDQLMLETITSLAGALDAKDRYTRGHSQAVANYAAALGHALGMTVPEVEELRAAGILHDIGKIGIPETILGKAGPLNEKEWEIMKQHSVIGAQQILYPVPSLRPLIPAVECHHENWDGSGHPHGYKGEKIPIGARVIAIVDAFHALTSDRCYRKAMPVAQAKHILELNSGKNWDPHLLEIFFGMLAQATPKPA